MATTPDRTPDNRDRTPPRDPHARRRMTLNLSAYDYAKLERLAEVERASIHDTIRRSVATRWRIYTAPNPEVAYPNLPQEELPPPCYLALVNAATGEITRLEIM